MAIERLTDARLRALKVPRGQRIEITDFYCPGLQVRASGQSITFTKTIRQNGKQCRRRLGTYPGLSLLDARKLGWEAQTAEHPDLPTEPSPVASLSAPTFAEVVEQYVERYLRPRKVRSWKNIRADLRHSHLGPLMDRPVGSIAKSEIIAVIDRIVADGKLHSAVNVLRRLKMCLNWAVDRDLIPANFCDRIRAPAKTNERDRVLENAEIVAVYRATFQLPSPFGEMIRTMMLTGQRRSEVATMRWADLRDGIWTIPREVVKKDRAHSVPLPATAHSDIRGLPFFAADGYVFTTSGGKRPSSNFSKTKKELDRLSGVTDWRLHDLRRTVRSKLAELGVPREIAQKVVNHEDGKVDRIYNRHSYLAEKREALERWERHLLALLQEEPK
jgi:integrase